MGNKWVTGWHLPSCWARYRTIKTSVAVSDSPAGSFSYYGTVHHPGGKPYGLGKDAYNFDPGVLLDKDGRVYMYTGFSPDSGTLRFLMGLRGGTYNGGTVVELEQDMITIRGEEHPTIPGKCMAAGTEFEDHPFFEASSIRRINDLYYLVYSSLLSHELCYATARSPFGPWHYGGTLVSIGDIGYHGRDRKHARNFLGNTHGGMVCVKGQWYIFYHRQTNRQKCARQGCAEKITIREDGSIPQVEVTSCGLNDGPLKGTGTYEARIACNLWGRKGTCAYENSRPVKDDNNPYFTQSGTDRDYYPDQYIANLRKGATAGYKYFDFSSERPDRISVTVRGSCSGKLYVFTDAEPMRVGKKSAMAARILLKPSASWQTFSADLHVPEETSALYFQYLGEGAVDFRDFTLSSK